MARVTVLASDKTGTLTTGAVILDQIEPFGRGGSLEPDRDRPVEGALAAVASADDFPNATMKALQAANLEDPGWPVAGRIPFDSAHKYSAVEFDGRGVWYVGAPDVLLAAGHEPFDRWTTGLAR